LHLPHIISEKIFEQTNCKNKSLRELSLFNCQIFLLRDWFQKDMKQCRSVKWLWKVFVKSTLDVDIWMEIYIQHDVYFDLNIRFKLFKLYSNILKCVNLIEIRLCMSLFIIFPCTLTYNLRDHCANTGSWFPGKIRTFEGKKPTLTSSYYWTWKKELIATKYVIKCYNGEIL
jgi:hypothetical protein